MVLLKIKHYEWGKDRNDLEASESKIEWNENKFKKKHKRILRDTRKLKSYRHKKLYKWRVGREDHLGHA